MSLGEIAKSELLYDRRCCNTSKLFFMYKRLELDRLVSAVNICLRKVKSKSAHHYTAGMLQDANSVESLVKSDDAFKVLKCLRCSSAYWQARKKELMAMIRQIGLPSIFFTNSAAESRWEELHKILYKTAYGKCLDDGEKLTFRLIR